MPINRYVGVLTFELFTPLRRLNMQSNPKDLGSETGATLVESAIALPFLLVFLFVSLDLLWANFRAVSLQHVAERGLRMAVIDGQNPAAVQAFILDLARGLGVELDPDRDGTSPFISLCPVGAAPLTALPCPGQVLLGVPGDLLALRIQIPLNNLLITGVRIFPGEVVVENRAHHESAI